MSDHSFLYGTDEPLPETRRLTAGPLQIVICDAAVQTVRYQDVEVLRGVQYPIRNADWGTFDMEVRDETIGDADAGHGVTYRVSFGAAHGRLEGAFFMTATAAGRVSFRLDLTATEDIEVNRAGFVLLHPIRTAAGAPLAVTHSDGTVDQTVLPERISPDQPALDIVAIEMVVDGINVQMRFDGEVFEMEDQRNWSDASFKTYCRPLSLPFPYRIAAGETVTQGIEITLSGDAAIAPAGAVGAIALGAAEGHLPEPAIAVEAGWQAAAPAIATLAVPATRLRVDTTSGEWHTLLADMLACVQGACDLEVVLPDDPAALYPALAELANALTAGRQAIRSVCALPSAYLKSYQPGGAWPEGATPEAAATAAARAFPGAEIVGGVLTNFTELNRFPAAARIGDAVTFGSTAIVHAADDLSVMQTLEALPQIFSSAKALAQGKPLHLGLIAIGMRSNPYGAAMANNVANRRMAMAHHDPRQRGLFGAAWMVGAVAATEATDVARMALAAPSGAFALTQTDGLVVPAYHVLRWLAARSGKPRHAIRSPEGTAVVAVSGAAGPEMLVANLTLHPVSLRLPSKAVVAMPGPADTGPDWLTTAKRRRLEQIELGPFEVAFVGAGQGA